MTVFLGLTGGVSVVDDVDGMSVTDVGFNACSAACSGKASSVLGISIR